MGLQAGAEAAPKLAAVPERCPEQTHRSQSNARVGGGQQPQRNSAPADHLSFRWCHWAKEVALGGSVGRQQAKEVSTVDLLAAHPQPIGNAAASQAVPTPPHPLASSRAEGGRTCSEPLAAATSAAPLRASTNAATSAAALQAAFGRPLEVVPAAA